MTEGAGVEVPGARVGPSVVADPSVVGDPLVSVPVGVSGAVVPGTPRYDYARRFGIYCVQFVSFRADTAGVATLNWWADRCPRPDVLKSMK